MNLSLRILGWTRPALVTLIGGVAAILATGIAVAQIAPSMPVERGDHTAAILLSGKVLIAGGDNLNGPVTSTTLYDASTNTWTTTGNLNTPRFLHAATVLASGRVLVTGGTNGSYLASTEIFDPLTNTWTTTDSMNVGRYGHTATLLPSGKVLVAGGETAFGATASVELYDPVTNAWTVSGDMGAARYAHTATLLASGKVLVAGGQNEGSGALATTELYDPVSNTWTAAPNLAAARSEHEATIMPNGDVLIAGGNAGLVLLASAERYSANGNTWSAAGTLSAARKQFGMTALASGKALVAGGYDGNGALVSTNLYDPATNAWTTVGNLSVPRWGHSVTQLFSGRVLAAGGYNVSSGYLSSVEVFDPSTNVWAGTGNTPPSTAATPLAPSGSITSTTPTYSWTSVSDATTYSLWVGDGSTGVVYATYSSQQAGCASGGTCAVTPPVVLTMGRTYSWGVLAGNAAGYGPWSAAMLFTVGPAGSPPVATTPLAPSGSITNTTPTYSWTAVPTATSYTLWAGFNGAGVVYGAYSAVEAGCGNGTGTCAVTPPVPLTAGRTYSWGVLTSNAAGNGPWSRALLFTVSAPSPTYSIGGTVTGLAAGRQVTLVNKGANALTITANGTFVFSTPVVSTGSYSVTVNTHPTGQICTVINGAGVVVMANVTNVIVTCSTTTTNTITTLDSAGGQYTSITVGADGLPTISYADGGNVKVAKCVNAECTGASAASPLFPTGGGGTSITLGSDGFPVISYSYRRPTASSPSALIVLKCTDRTCTGPRNSFSISGTQPTLDFLGGRSSITLGADGRPVFAYSYRGYSIAGQTVPSRLGVATCSTPACTSVGTNSTVDTGIDVGAVSITLGADGRPVISYYDQTNGNLKLAKCGNAACSSGNTITTIDSVGDVGQYTSIAVPDDARPVISYYDASNGNLKVAKCGNAACSSGNTTTILDSTGDVGQYNSIARGADGLAMISYYDATNGNLKLAKCGNVACSSGNTLTTIDSTGDVGQYTSIVVGADGLPTISYYNAGTGDLKVAKCFSATCM